MSHTVHVLHLEDSPRDAELIAAAIHAAGVDAAITCAAGRDEFLACLERQAFDAVICDHNLVGYDGLSGMRSVRKRQPDVPVLMVSGSIGEEEAIRCLKAGATDYILKDRLQRLGPALKRAIREARAVRRHTELERRFASFVEQSDDVFYFLSLNPERVAYLSPAFEKVWGMPVHRAYEDPRAWTDSVHPEDRPRLDRALERFLSGADREFWEEYRVIRPDGAVRDIVSQATLTRDAGGLPTGISGFARDVTERKQLEEQFRQSQKMEAIGRLAGGVAHDFHNVLTIILGFTELVSQQIAEEDPCQSDLGEVRAAAESACRLTQQLLAFSRKQILRPVVLDLNAAIHRSQRMLGRLVGEDIGVEVRTMPRPAVIRADPGQLEQILMNLSVNARDAMPHGGTLTIETLEATLDQVQAAVGDSPDRSAYVVLTVRDTGHGMSSETLAKVFEPFFTTKGPHGGTGLGLATVYGIVKQSRGGIRLASEPGQGTTVTIYFPAASEGVTAPADAEQKPASDARPSETILIVEDQEALLRLAERTLARGGYRVLAARTPSEAFSLASGDARRIHLLLTDVVMPEMNGRAVAESMAALRPGIKVLYMSGYADDKIFGLGLSDEGTALLEKPFTPARLLTAVRAALDQERETSAGCSKAGPAARSTDGTFCPD